MDLESSWKSANYLIIIVNYRAPDHVVACLDSLASEVSGIEGCQVVVVDNDSLDGSFEKISNVVSSNEWGSWASVIQSEYNGGFSYGNNYAIRQALGSSSPPAYFHLLNPDTEVRKGALVELKNFMDENPSAGIAGGSFENEDGSDWNTAFRFPTIISELDRGLRLGLVTKLISNYVVAMEMPSENAKVDWVSGASFLIRAKVIDDIGLMDEEFFLYYEETDFCFNAQKSGWQCWYVPSSRVMHAAGVTTGINELEVQKRRMPQYMFDSRKHYFIKNHGWLYAACADFIWISAYVTWCVRRVVQRKPKRDAPYLLRDAIRNSCFFPGKGKKLE